MNQKSIIFKTNLVEQILDGNKWQTRRLVNSLEANPIQPYSVGDILWVREIWSPDYSRIDSGLPIVYKAGSTLQDFDYTKHSEECSYITTGQEHFNCLKCINFKWRPAIHLAKKDSRLFLEITSIRKERLQNITEEDAKAEGCPKCPDCEGSSRYREMWGRGAIDAPEVSACGGRPWYNCYGLCEGKSAKEWFAEYWDSLKPKQLWDDNPYVWILQFRSI